MKKLTLAIIVALVASLAVAQGPGGRPGGQGGPGGPGGPGGRGRMDPKAMLDMMTKNLKLSPSQAKQVGALMASRQADMQKLRTKITDRKARGPEMKKMMDAFNAKMKKILTKDQAAKYDKMQAERRARFGGGRGGPGGPGGRPGGAGGPGGPPRAGGI